MSKKTPSYRNFETAFTTSVSYSDQATAEYAKIKKELAAKKAIYESPSEKSEVHHDYIYQILDKNGKVLFGVKEDNTTFIAEEFKNDIAIKFLEETYRYQGRISNKDINVDILKTRLTKTLFFLEKISDSINDENVKDEIKNFKASLEAACF